MRFSSRVPFGLEPNAWAAAIAARRAAGASMIDLSEANPTRTGLVAAAAPPARWTPADLARYEPDPRGAMDAREAVARYYAARGARVDPADVVLTASTSEAYAHAFRLLADPGEAILVPRPSYPLFVPLARAEGVAVRTYRLAWDGRWHVDFADLEAAIGPRVRAIVTVQPNHPTGSCLAADERARLVTLAARRGVAIVCDEVFGDYGWPAAFRGAGVGFHAPDAAASAAAAPAAAPAAAVDARDDAHGLPTLAGADQGPLTLVMSGLSKLCGLPQMKAGWIALGGDAAARAAARERLEWLADLFLSVSAPAQLALPEWLGARAAFQERVHARIALNLERIAWAHAKAPALTPLPADGGWVALLRLPERDDDDERWLLRLLERGVIAHPGHFYDLDGRFAVVSLIVDPATFDRGIRALEDLVS